MTPIRYFDLFLVKGYANLTISGQFISVNPIELILNMKTRVLCIYCKLVL